MKKIIFTVFIFTVTMGCIKSETQYTDQENKGETVNNRQSDTINTWSNALTRCRTRIILRMYRRIMNNDLRNEHPIRRNLKGNILEAVHKLKYFTLIAE